MKKDDSGFTLVELMIVVLILGVLLSIAIPLFYSIEERTYQRTCLTNIINVERSWERYRADNNGEVDNPVDYETDLLPMIPIYFKYIPKCPDIGVYTIIQSHPLRITCSEHGSPQVPIED